MEILRAFSGFQVVRVSERTFFLNVRVSHCISQNQRSNLLLEWKSEYMSVIFSNIHIKTTCKFKGVMFLCHFSIFQTIYIPQKLKPRWIILMSHALCQNNIDTLCTQNSYTNFQRIGYKNLWPLRLEKKNWKINEISLFNYFRRLIEL